MNFKHFAVIFGVVLVIQASQQSPLEDDDLKPVAVPSYSKILRLERAALSNDSTLSQDLEADNVTVVAEAAPIITDLADGLYDMVIDFIEFTMLSLIIQAQEPLNCINVAQDAINSSTDDLDECTGAFEDFSSGLADVIFNMNSLTEQAQTAIDALGSCVAGDIACIVIFVQTSFNNLNNVYTLLQEALQNLEILLADSDNIYIAPCVQGASPKFDEIINETWACFGITN